MDTSRIIPSKLTKAFAIYDYKEESFIALKRSRSGVLFDEQNDYIIKELS